jgi:rhamnose utilization protein RhaD (predicted bifunctional aldolase and dehydrogenase)
VRLEPLRKLRKLDKTVRRGHGQLPAHQPAGFLRPNPSVETLLHAFLPHKFIDHVHSTAVLALTDQPDNKRWCGKSMATASPMCPTPFPVLRWPSRWPMCSTRIPR